jgi:hypothetical protein
VLIPLMLFLVTPLAAQNTVGGPLFLCGAPESFVSSSGNRNLVAACTSTTVNPGSCGM